MAKVLFIQNLFMEQLGAMYLSAALKEAGHETRLAIGSDQQITQIAREYKPQLVAATVLTGFQERWIKLAQAIKGSLTPSPVVIFGGPHPTFFPQVVLRDGVDFACRGEGERVIVELAKAIDQGPVTEQVAVGIQNLCFREGGGHGSSEARLHINPMRPLESLDTLPMADRELSFAYPFVRRDPNVHFIAGRGCPYSCSFCFNKQMHELSVGLGPMVRFRSVDSVIEELKGVHKRWKIPVVYFQDDTFVLNRKWLFEFLPRYASELRLPMYCTVRADLVTKEMAVALKDAGCYRVSFGLESGVERIRNQVLDKRIGDDTIRQAAAILRNAGIRFQTTNMMGLPGERLEDAFRTLELNIEIGSDIAWTSLYQPYPGTALGKYTLEQGLIDGLPDDLRMADAHTASMLKQPDIREVERLQKFVYLGVKFPRTLPFIRRAVHHDHARLYHWIHRITYLLFYFKRITKMSWKRAFEEAVMAWKYY